ncbi:hypothetical protein FGB62_6g233 [Gracilaria domingensis]|nr:hypothetical protein FGB62_6g233 [Gracilaria domingensis]
MRGITARRCAFFTPPFVSTAPTLLRHARRFHACRGNFTRSTDATCCVSEQVVVRRAYRSDIGGAVSVLSRAFANEEGQARRITHSPIGRLLGASRALRIVELFSRLEFWLQLNSRIRATGVDAEGPAHAVLVAIERETGALTSQQA